jgi:hypothetical protein
LEAATVDPDWEVELVAVTVPAVLAVLELQVTDPSALEVEVATVQIRVLSAEAPTATVL